MNHTGKHIAIGLSLICSILISACTEEIIINLNDSDPQLVIEGSVPANGDVIQVKVTQSVNFDESNVFPAVEGALVTISSESGASEILTETSPGIYTSDFLTGTIGETYNLNLVYAENVFTSTSTIPNKVDFDSLIVLETEGGGGFGGGGGGGTGYEVIVWYDDPVDEQNYYRFVEYVNGEFSADHIFDDRLINGTSVKTSLLSFNRNLNEGDVLTVEMQCVDKSVYDYFNSFGNLTGGLQAGGTPANPYTNIVGSKLGYFSAHTREILEFIIL